MKKETQLRAIESISNASEKMIAAIKIGAFSKIEFIANRLKIELREIQADEYGIREGVMMDDVERPSDYEHIIEQ